MQNNENDSEKTKNFKQIDWDEVNFTLPDSDFDLPHRKIIFDSFDVNKNGVITLLEIGKIRENLNLDNHFDCDNLIKRAFLFAFQFGKNQKNNSS